MKRLLDIVVSVLVPGSLFPLFAAIALVIRLVDGPPVLYREWRVGRGGRPFRICKFRTMMTGPEPGPGVAASSDPRITPLGLYLKRARLDELPQFYNILVGHMSLVGPRPLTRCHLDTLPPSLAARLLETRPGLTSTVSLEFLAEDDVLASVSEPEEIYLRVLLPEKVRRELARRESNDVWQDFKTAFRTVYCLLSPRARIQSSTLVTELLEQEIPGDESPND